MTSATYPSKPDVERRLHPGRDVLPKTLVDLAAELGIDSRRQSTRLQDVVDIDSLYALVQEPRGTKSDIKVSFSVWGIRYDVTPSSVAATRER